MAEVVNVEVSTCFHCGDLCSEFPIQHDQKVFCCDGCKLVYEILQENDLCTYYDLDTQPGISLKSKNFGNQFTFLQNKEIASRLLDYADETFCKVTFTIPAIHCSSCIWLLENLYKIREGISASRVNFIKKELSVNFDPTVITLKELVELLATLGYEPDFSLDNYDIKIQKKTNKDIFIKLGVTGFCTGNIMLLSFPEYFGLEGAVNDTYRIYFIWLNMILAIPVFFYGASGYFISAYKSLRKKVINLDVPLSIGILTLFVRSLFETVSGAGSGYWDSMAGLVFFLLVGKWLQNKTFENLSFDRNYKSYFPLAATVIYEKGGEEIVPVTNLIRGNRIIIRNKELIPADSILKSSSAWIDYSFVTGEADPVLKQMGDYIYAGGRQIGPFIELTVEKPVSQSYLTQLWNNEAFAKEKTTPITKLAGDFSKYFTNITLSIAILTLLFWYLVDPSVMWNAFTAVLIIACPCALSLSMPFTMENTMRIFGRNGYYVKNTGVIQHLATITQIVFDKTGTLTRGKASLVNFKGERLSVEEQQMVKSLASGSTHPLSRKLFHHFNGVELLNTSDFLEIPGEGVEANIAGHKVKMGSLAFNDLESIDKTFQGAEVHLTIDGSYKGFFTIINPYRYGLSGIIEKLKAQFKLSLLSGDHKVDLPVLLPLFDNSEQLRFDQSPVDKLNYIKSLQDSGERVLMVGDGLNDAGALKQSDVGLVLTEEVNAFFPACDMLADAKKFERFYDVVRFSRTSVNIVKASFLLSIVYNVIGLSWAISGTLSPVFAAIFMPLSSISVVAFAAGMSSLYARFRKL